LIGGEVEEVLQVLFENVFIIDEFDMGWKCIDKW
jgi:hypothetical protein